MFKGNVSLVICHFFLAVLSSGGQNTDPQSMDYPYRLPSNGLCYWSLVIRVGNWVNEVLGQFSQYKDPKWNLIHSVS